MATDQTNRYGRLDRAMRVRLVGLAFVAAGFGGGTCLAQSLEPPTPRDAGTAIDFNRDIRPILSDKCFQCHGPDSGSREADLRLDQKGNATQDRGDYAVVTPGNSAASELLRRVTSEEAAELMPPPETGKALKPAEIDLLRRWIDQGAEWSLAWAYVSPVDAEALNLAEESWSSNWIDKFILARLQDEGLAPSPEADRTTLIRRLSLDLLGLPPTPEEVDRFVNDQRPDAYEQLVDRLLASPHFGERMAAYWLDLVRFADTVGYHGDQTHNIWPYRDYVIHAFNHNLPFDQFTKEQLAGDLLPNANVDQLIASGYNRLLQTSHEGGVQLKEYRAIYLADRVRNVSQVWMGATIGCAQCHDHKFDPYTARDFYSMGAFFADIDDEGHLRDTAAPNLNALPTVRGPEIEVLSIYQRERLSQLKTELSEFEPTQDQSRHEILSRKINALEQAKAKTMIVTTAEPRSVRVQQRGDWQDERGELVDPAPPAFLPGEPTSEAARLTRLDLAHWLTDAERGTGGLTARVTVNRLWYLMFGRGIAPVLDDFGGQGEPPEHPELLDKLALEFLRSDWNVKHMLRLIVLSSTYRQSSLTSPALQERDPYNKLLARQARFRVPAETVRDLALSIGGLLQDEVGGPSVKPYQPAGYYRHLNFPGRKYHEDHDQQQWRRGVYVHWQRQFLHPMLRAFDAPSREECTAMRPRSNTSLAALTLLNDPTFVEAARGLADRILASGSVDSVERIGFAFRLATSRSPTDEELSILADVAKSSSAYFEENPTAVDEVLSIGLREVDARFDRVELAAWTNVARVILNLGETTTRY